MGVREFGEVLRQRRERAGLTKADVARAAKVSPSYVTRLEGGDRAYKSVGQDVLRGLAGALGATEEELEAALYDRPLPRPARVSPEMPREIPIVAHVSAGTGSGSAEGYVYAGDSEVRGRLLRAVVVRGDCLAPQIPSGAVVIIDVTAASEVRDGQVVAATLLDSGEHVLKRFYQHGDTVTLAPNIGQPIIVAADRVKIEGVAVEIRQRLDR